MLTYTDALDYILGLANYETSVDTQAAAARFNLDTVRKLAQLSGWNGGRYIHIAGTKGKGSTAAILESILRAAGYSTGLFTSPHLHSLRERIRVGGRLIASSDVARYTTRLQPLVRKLQQEHPTLCPVTTFDFLVVLALSYFSRRQVDIAIMEAGLGGRLDATNVVTPLVSIITSISYDHTKILGNTLAQIAGEKAGIIKPGGVVVVAPQEEEALRVIRERCRQQQARLILVDKEYRWSWTEDGLDVCGPTRSVSALHLGLLGHHQVVNAVTALAAIEAIAEVGFIVDEAALAAGLSSVWWPGRLEVIRRRPLIIVDGAHNADSAEKLRLALTELYPVYRWRIVLGISSDKDIDGIVRNLAPLANSFSLVRSQHSRAATFEQMEAALSPWHIPVDRATGVSGVLASLRHSTSVNEGILVTGSLFVVAEAREAMGFHSIKRRYTPRCTK